MLQKEARNITFISDNSNSYDNIYFKRSDVRLWNLPATSSIQNSCKYATIPSDRIRTRDFIGEDREPPESGTLANREIRAFFQIRARGKKKTWKIRGSTDDIKEVFAEPEDEK